MSENPKNRCEFLKIKREAEDQLKKLVRSWFDEDKVFKDITTALVIPNKKGRLIIFSKSKKQFTVAGADFIKLIVNKYLKCTQGKKEPVKVKILKRDGMIVQTGDKIAEIEGNIKTLLSLERIILNLVSILSGIATETRELVKLAKGVKILSTRKTAPGLRYLEKYAVCVGGGFTHRKNLADAVLIKDNHIKALGGIKNLCKIINEKQSKIKKLIKSGTQFEIEVQNQDELESLLDISKYLGKITIMLDNFMYNDLKRAIKKIKEFSKKHGIEILVEVSGGVNLQNIRKIAKLKPDFISAGYITIQPRIPDISADIVPI